jgi:very-short-patch-repair endonuclease
MNKQIILDPSKLILIKRQFKLPDSNYPFDFLISNKFILEVDGRKHFHQVSNWGDPEKNKRKRCSKNETCI